MYIHELQDWPRFHRNREQLAEPLAAVRHQQGRLIGHMEALGFNLRQEAVLQTLTSDVLKSSDRPSRCSMSRGRAPRKDSHEDSPATRKRSPGTRSDHRTRRRRLTAA